MISRSASRLERLYLTHAGDAWRLATALCEDTERARRCGTKALLRSFGTFRDLRNPVAFEALLRRAVVAGCKEPLATRLARRFRGRPDSSDDLWRRFQRQPHRRKAALALRYLERLSEEQVADVLGCSTAMARALINRGLNDLSPRVRFSADATATELMRALAHRAELVRSPVEPDAVLLRRAALRRKLTVAVVVAAILTLVLSGARLTGTIRDDSSREQIQQAQPSPVPGSFEELGITDIESRPRALAGSTAIATGEVAGDRWHFIAREDAGELCMEIEAGSEFQTSQCIPRPSGVFETFVGSDESHDATFIYGYTAEAVARLEIETDDEKSRPVGLLAAPPEVDDLLGGRFFVAVIPEQLVALEMPAGDSIRTVLRAESADGGPLQHQPLYFARP